MPSLIEAHDKLILVSPHHVTKANLSTLGQGSQLRRYLNTNQRDERLVQGIPSATLPGMAENLKSWDETWSKAGSGK
ncbi:hypothetical protein MN608_00152 [Microdochium nivale]|nr:hypothetical protein MN608_00152 [Microdochium nivale]